VNEYKIILLFNLYICCRGINGKTSKWRKVEHVFEANATNHNSSLQITTTGKGVIWLDQISAMPLDTYKVC
jgi:alpha-N-arabinofuranosidase